MCVVSTDRGPDERHASGVVTDTVAGCGRGRGRRTAASRGQRAVPPAGPVRPLLSSARVLWHYSCK